MPRIIDRPAHYQKLLDTLDILAEEEATYRQRLADALSSRTLSLGPAPSDDEMRAALADWPQVCLIEGKEFVTAVLKRSGKLHLLLRLSEIELDALGPEGLLAALAQDAREEDIAYFREADPMAGVESPPLTQPDQG